MASPFPNPDEITATLERYLLKYRPPIKIRKQLDLGYEIKGRSIVLFEIRPQWNDPRKIVYEPYAKTTYVLKDNIWKVYWMRANLKWYLYEPKPTVKKITDFLNLVEEDKYCCFKG